ncbi:unnamed protein product [Urochloa humidicola]
MSAISMEDAGVKDSYLRLKKGRDIQATCLAKESVLIHYCISMDMTDMEMQGFDYSDLFFLISNTNRMLRKYWLLLFIQRLHRHMNVMAIIDDGCSKANFGYFSTCCGAASQS